MDRVGRMTSIQGKHLCCTTRGCQKNQLLLQSDECLDDGCCQSGLTRTSRTTQDHHYVFRPIRHKSCKEIDGLLLFDGGCQSQRLENAIFQFVVNHIGHKGTIFLGVKGVKGS